MHDELIDDEQKKYHAKCLVELASQIWIAAPGTEHDFVSRDACLVAASRLMAAMIMAGN